MIVFSFEKVRDDWELYYLAFEIVVGQVLFPVWFFQDIERMKINNLVDNKIIYWINIFVYLLLISFSSTENIKLIIKAIKDGYKGRLGKKEILR